jgi:transposase
MDYIQGKPRTQIVLIDSSLEEKIEQDNPVRIIDEFVNRCNLEEFGFTHARHASEGRPPYHPGDLLKLFIYGYLNRIRTSRLLERECKRNLELMWLLNELTPDHNTIANFRKDNPKAIKQVFRNMVTLCKRLDLIGGKVVAIDGTKLRAQNSKKNNFNQKKIDDHLAYIENKLHEYLDAIDVADIAEDLGLDPELDKEKIKEKIAKLNAKKLQYKKLEKQLIETGQEQISTTDTDSKKLAVRQNILEVCYNIQASVDAKHNLPIDYKTTNNNDTHALANMAARAKSILGHDGFTALLDKGYHTGSEISRCHEMNIETLVAVPSLSTQAPDPAYNIDQFIYNANTNTYQCPQGNILYTNGSWYDKGGDHKIRQYKTKACKHCPDRDHCTKAKNGRMIERSEFTEAVQRNKNAIENNRELYKKRQEIVEHPFGTIKRQWGFDYTLMKGKKKVDGEVGLIFIAYLFTRMRSILGKDGLFEAIRGFISGRLKRSDAVIHPKTLLRLFVEQFLKISQNSIYRGNNYYIYCTNAMVGRF